MRAGTVSSRPRLKPWYRLATTEAGLTARFGASALFFEGHAARRLLPVLLPLLDGTRTLDELVATLGPRTQPAIEQVLEALDAHDLLLHADVPSGAAGALLAATAYGVRDPADVRTSVLGDGETAAEIARLLRASGVGQVGESWDAELVIAAPDDDVDERLDEWNATAIARRAPWLPLTPFDGTIAAVGPLIVPGETACRTCLAARRSVDPYAPCERPLSAGYLSSPSLRAVCTGLATAAAVRWLTTGDTPVLGAVLAVEYATQAVTRHVVHRVPRCRSCAPSVTATLAPWGRGDALAV